MRGGAHPGPMFAGELRGTERLIAIWRQEASKHDGPPPITAFDFFGSSYRFVICTKSRVGKHTFLIYGSQFAQLFSLPEAPAVDISLADLIPDAYLPVFREGCSEVLARMEPVPLSGFVVRHERIELYRAVFLPLAKPMKSRTRLVIGSFSRRVGPTVSEFDAVWGTSRVSAEVARALRLGGDLCRRTGGPNYSYRSQLISMAAPP
jgi:hypothetical protein